MAEVGFHRNHTYQLQTNQYFCLYVWHSWNTGCSADIRGAHSCVWAWCNCETFLWCRFITASHIWPPDRRVCCLFLLSNHSFPVLRSFGARLLSLVLQRQQHLEINNSSIAPLLSSSLARVAPSWPYGSVLSRARLLLRTLAPRKQRRGEGCCLSLFSPHIRLSLSPSVYSFPLPLSNFIPITFYSWKRRCFPISLSLSLILFFMVVLWLTLRCVTVSGDCISLHATFAIVPTKKM